MGLNALILKYVNKTLLRNEFCKRMPIFENATFDKNYNGGDIENVIAINEASSIQAGGLTAAAEISEMEAITGTVSKDNVPKLFGSLKFKRSDLFLEDGALNENRIKFKIKEQIPMMLDRMKIRLNRMWFAGLHLATLTANGESNGTVTVERVGSFRIHQKIILLNSTPASAVGYIKSIDKNKKQLKLVTALTGDTPLNCSAFTTALTSRIYGDGNVNTGTHALKNQFNCIRTNLLSYENGGDANFMGHQKSLYPYLQAYNGNGSTITPANIIESIFDHYSDFVADDDVIQGPHECCVPSKAFGCVKKALEARNSRYVALKGADRSAKTSMYGDKFVEVAAPDGDTLVIGNAQGMPEDAFYFMKWKHLKVYSHKFIEVIKSPDGNMYHVVRVDNDDYYYIVDCVFLGDMYPDNLQQLGIVHSVPDLRALSAA